MRAVGVMEFGASPELMELPKPTPGPGEVLVRLAAASLNPFDRAISEGFLRHMPHVFPLVLGIDGAGVVEEVSEGIDRFEVGDAVYGAFMHEPLGKGTLAEYIAVPEDALISKAPNRIPLTRAAAAPGGGMTAIGLVNATRIDADQSVLIVGASGGVGLFAVQLAATRGARVIATARPDAERTVLEMGATSTIDYTHGSVADRVREIEPSGVDVLLDLISDPEPFAANAEVVRAGGQAVSLRYAAGPQALASDQIRVINFNSREQPGALGFLEELTQAIDRGRLRIVVDAEVPLEEAATIAARAQDGARGKTLVVIERKEVPQIALRDPLSL